MRQCYNRNLDRRVRALPFPAKDDKPNEVQYFERLKEGRSRVLYVSYGGSKRWRVFYEGAKPRTNRIGTYPEPSIKDARDISRGLIAIAK